MSEQYPKDAFRFLSFSPISYIKDNKAAFDALDFSLDLNNTSVRNIAISGPFGAGKSSLWRSYKEHILSKGKYRNNYILPSEDEIIGISLAKFNEEKKIDNIEKTECVAINISNSHLKSVNEGKTEKIKNIIENNVNDNDLDEEKIEYQIEKSILQQILFSVEKDEIPCLESYKYTGKYRPVNLILSIIGAYIFLWVMFFIFDKGVYSWHQFFNVPGDIIDIDMYQVLFWVMVVLTFIIGKYLYSFFVKAENVNICGLSFKGLDVSFEQSSGSLINQNYSAIVYFFEKTKKKVVAFEDLDRFSSNKVFVKLRELNTILNNCPSLKNKIKFVYMVKENLFTKYERTKFFEMIIPVVPVVSMESCADFLLDRKHKRINVDEEKINDGDLSEEVYALEKIDDELLIIVGRHSNDLRIIKDCVNEYLIYKNQIENDLKKVSELDNKIFAMIVYKNYYPQDFERLHRQKGYLHDIISNYKEEISKNEKENKNLEQLQRKSLKAFCGNRYEGFGQWAYNQCLKLELKIKYDSDGLKNDDQIINNNDGKVLTSLLFTLLETGYIDENYEFYISRKYLGEFSLKDYSYFEIVQKEKDPDYNLEIQNISFLENKIISYQWSLISVLNNRMFAYELGLFDESSISRSFIIKNLIYAMLKAEKQKKGFFKQFLEFLDQKIQNHVIVIRNNMYEVSSEVVDVSTKDIFWKALYTYMDENTLSILFDEE